MHQALSCTLDVAVAIGGAEQGYLQIVPLYSGAMGTHGRTDGRFLGAKAGTSNQIPSTVPSVFFLFLRRHALRYGLLVSYLQ